MRRASLATCLRAVLKHATDAAKAPAMQACMTSSTTGGRTLALASTSAMFAPGAGHASSGLHPPAKPLK
jgi:hypothetical protein